MTLGKHLMVEHESMSEHEMEGLVELKKGHSLKPTSAPRSKET